MAITASMVKELRELTGAGMMDCKKALTETNGDMDAAVEVLKKSGAAKAEKKAARIAAEGIAKVAIDGNTAVVVEVNSETDFVAKNAIFQEFVQAVAEHGDTEELHKIAQAATDIFERSTNVSAVGNPVVDALLNYYLRIAEKNNIKVKLDVTIPEVLTISSLSLSIIIGNTFDNAIEACCDLPAEQRIIHLQLRKQYRSLFYRLENPYSDTSRGIRIGEYHGYGLKNINRIVQENHGDFYTKKKDGVFTVQVRLNCEN